MNDKYMRALIRLHCLLLEAAFNAERGHYSAGRFGRLTFGSARERALRLDRRIARAATIARARAAPVELRAIEGGRHG